jgi:hypothetical protein
VQYPQSWFKRHDSVDLYYRDEDPREFRVVVATERRASELWGPPVFYIDSAVAEEAEDCH